MLCGVIATKQYLSPIKRFIVTQIPLRHIVLRCTVHAHHSDYRNRTRCRANAEDSGPVIALASG